MTPNTSLLAFEISGRRYALPVSVVREVIRAVAIAPLPKAPPIVEGIINLRGTLLPVLDVRQRFGIPPSPVALDQHFIVAAAGSRIVALRVDRALDLLVVDETAVEPVAGIVPGVDHVAGIARLADGLLIIHDLEHFLSLDEAQELDGLVRRA